jgi:hypothetical protein
MSQCVVILSSNSKLEFVKSLVGDKCIIVMEALAEAFLNPFTAGACSLCLVDRGVNGTMGNLLHLSGVTRIVGTRGLRRHITGGPMEPGSPNIGSSEG